jgi:DNA (cytosine-5)-methyltransferase 1
VLDAQHFGVAQRRRRVFIVGNLGNEWRTPAEILAIGESSARYLEQSNTKRKETPGSVSDGIADQSRAGNFELYDFPKESISPTLNARRAKDTMTYQEVARMQGFGDYEIDEIVGALKARDYKDATDLVIKAYDEYNDSLADTHHTLRAGTKQSTGLLTSSTVRRLTPTECERLQGFSDGWTEGQADSHRYKQLGNAVAVPVVEWIIQRFIQAMKGQDDHI